ncbi:MAG: hypothetical protein UT89_C0006G0007 [Parcubacteria group bacterium GW2011_GWE1_40_20]|nr:MAG: hypothetical protein UT89_C0006G0007 [Parcubacteria group bacterium GW2011_GWE1_40_20]
MYEDIKLLAKEKRGLYSIQSNLVSLSLLRKIYKTEGIKISYSFPTMKLRNLRAAYFNDGNDVEVLLKKGLPDEAKIFSLVHELKHHYVDRKLIGTGTSCNLSSYDSQPEIEKAAEIFAAEFIFPEQEFLQTIKDYGITPQNIQPEFVVKYKKRLGNIPISYTFLKKRLEWFKFIPKGAYDKIKFKKLEYEICGVPFYLYRRGYH